MTTISFDEVFSDAIINETLETLALKKDSCGIDGMFLSQLPEYWKINRENILGILDKESFIPGAVRSVEILNCEGHSREIALFNSIDRLILGYISRGFKNIDEAILSESSFAFRQNMGVSAAVKKAVAHLSTGNTVILKTDILGFFDNIDLNRLIMMLERVVDAKLGRLIRKYLFVDVEMDGVYQKKTRGIIQGSPISTFLSNYYLNELDLKLEGEGVRFCRYGDDYIFFFKSTDIAREVYESFSNELAESYGLQINIAKTVISENFNGKYLGYYFRKEKNGAFTAYKKPGKSAVIYSNWHKGAVKRVDRSYHLINDGILARKDFNILFKNESGKKYIPVETTNAINIYSNVTLSGSFLEFIARRRMDLNVFDKHGNMIGYFASAMDGHRTRTMIKQVEIYTVEASRLATAKAIEMGAIHNLRANLKYYYKKKKSENLQTAIGNLSEASVAFNECQSMDKLFLIEARARLVYYSAFNEIINDGDFIFEKRTKRPPQDPINALISFGNVFLYNRIAMEINKTTLDIRIGFIHSSNRRNQTLNLDIAEIFKPVVVDRTIFSMINRNMIHPDLHFENSENGGIYLNDDGKRMFIKELYYKLMQKTKDGDREVTYETRIREEIQKMLRLVLHGEKYKPYKYQI